MRVKRTSSAERKNPMEESTWRNSKGSRGSKDKTNNFSNASTSDQVDSTRWKSMSSNLNPDVADVLYFNKDINKTNNKDSGPL